MIPQRKVAAGALGGAISTIVIWGLSAAGVQVPPDVAAAIASLITVGVAYMVPNSPEAE